MKTKIISSIILSIISIIGQTLDADSITFYNNTQILNPFTGGFNAASFHNIDLNKDNILDLVVYEKSNQILLPYLCLNTSGKYEYYYKPEYAEIFPKINGWLQLQDYDNDKDYDLFLLENNQINVYENYGNLLYPQFQKIKNGLYTDYYGIKRTINTNVNDYPLIKDIDGDNDLDIVNFNINTGATLEYHKNLSQETYNNSDSLHFKQIDECWGNFEEINCDSITTNLDCSIKTKKSTNRVAHIGYGAVNYFDCNNDGINDLTYSKIDCSTINYLKNENNIVNPIFEQKLLQYQINNTPFNLPTYPITYQSFLYNQTIPSTIVSYGINSSNNFYNPLESNYLIENNKIITKQFLQNNTLDGGRNTTVLPIDLDGDKKIDLLTISETSNLNNSETVVKTYFQKQSHTFSYDSYNPLQMITNNMKNIHIQKCDYNNDNKPDILLTTSLVNEFYAAYSYVIYGNTASYFTASEKIDTLNIPINSNEYPYYSEKNSDKIIYIPKSNGTLQIYKYTNNWELFQNIKLKSENENYTIAEAYITNDTLLDLIYTSNQTMKYIENYDWENILNGTYETIKNKNKLNNELDTLRIPKNVKIQTINESNTTQLWLGCVGGGIKYYGKINENDLEKEIRIYPNPAENILNIENINNQEVRIYDYTGKIIYENKKKENLIVDLTQFKSNLYIVKIGTKNFKFIKK